LPGEKATPSVAFCFFLNHLLDAEPWARERLAPFAGEALELCAPPLPRLRLTILPDGRVEAGGAEPALAIRLGPETLLAAARSEAELMRSVELAGNAKLASEVMALVRHLRWDAEEDLSKLVGDVAAQRIVRAVRSFIAWQADAAGRLARALADYASEEARFVVPRREHEMHARAVAELRDALGRLEKRIARLD
jgi:ubiquinone biosynthesis protein UbiJ